jgi:hypothetical protein
LKRSRVEHHMLSYSYRHTSTPLITPSIWRADQQSVYHACMTPSALLSIAAEAQLRCVLPHCPFPASFLAKLARPEAEAMRESASQVGSTYVIRYCCGAGVRRSGGDMDHGCVTCCHSHIGQCARISTPARAPLPMHREPGA